MERAGATRHVGIGKRVNSIDEIEGVCMDRVCGVQRGASHKARRRR
jgi:hypothetical protein